MFCCRLFYLNRSRAGVEQLENGKAVAVTVVEQKNTTSVHVCVVLVDFDVDVYVIDVDDIKCRRRRLQKSQ